MPDPSGYAGNFLLSIEGAFHRPGSTLQDVGVDHCSFHIFVAKELLYCVDIVSILQISGTSMDCSSK
jgi:hypothetical protein